MSDRDSVSNPSEPSEEVVPETPEGPAPIPIILPKTLSAKEFEQRKLRPIKKKKKKVKKKKEKVPISFEYLFIALTNLPQHVLDGKRNFFRGLKGFRIKPHP